MSTTGPFKPLAENEIRLLRIQRGSDNDDLTCSLEKHNLETTVQKYTAISYAWGPPEDPHFTCHVGSFAFNVRQNAFNILRILRKADGEVVVWLDALCINQKDKTEKGDQIRLMYRVYKQAKSTAIWLGEADDSTEHVVKFVGTLDIGKIMDEFRSSHKGNWMTKSFILDELALHPNKATLVNGIARLFRAVWFSRVWIRQECAVRGNPYAIRGPYRFTWAQLTALGFLFQQRYGINWPDWTDFRFDDIEPTLDTISAIETYRIRERREGNSTRANPLFHNVLRARSSLAEKPHDKVYALSSMASDIYKDTNEVFLRPNYHLSWQEIYVNAARFFFEQDLISSQVLNQAGLIYQGVNSDLPSWVPDWRYPAIIYFEPLHDWAAGGSMNHVRTRISALTKKERLRLLTYYGAASILPLCAPLSERTQQLEIDQIRLDIKMPQLQEIEVQVEAERLRTQERWLAFQESALRAALVLDILTVLQDEITYISPRSSWFYTEDFRDHRQNILDCDEQNLKFLASFNREFYITSEPLRQAYHATLISSQDFDSSHAPEDLVKSAEEWRRWLKDDCDLALRHAYHAAIVNSVAFRNNIFAWTTTGYMTLVPSITQRGDHIVVFAGYQMPFVIRPVQDWYMLVGMCYVHGMMKGDAGILIEEFNIKFEGGKTIVKRPQGDVRANGLKLEAGRYVEILGTLGKRWVRLI